jgi:type IV secretion system protein VirB10
LGKYDSHVAYGQSRVQVIWTRLIYPDGSSIDLGAMLGQDAAGGAGFHDKVNNHYVRMFSMALLTSAFSAGIQLSQNTGSTSTTATPTASQTATQALGQQMGELGIEIARKNMNIQPTITVPIGYRFNVRVSRDIVFEKPYSERDK